MPHAAMLSPFDLLLMAAARLRRWDGPAVLQSRSPRGLPDESITRADRPRCGEAKVLIITSSRPSGGHQLDRLQTSAPRTDPVWHGGMLESGIGRAHNIHLASLPNFSLPGDIAASKRYYQPDLIDPEIDIARDGTIEVPTGPGIGVNILRERVEKATLRHLSL